MTKIYRKFLLGKGSILLLTALFMGSAGIRVVTSATEARAADEPDKISVKNSTELPLVPQDRIEPAVEVEPERLMNLVEALNLREKQIGEREKKAEIQAETLAIAREEIEKRLVELEKAEQQLRETIALADEAAENDLVRLTAVYENMKPKDAAALFEEMDPKFAAGFMGRMRPNSAANIMAGLSPEIAYSISAILAGRNAEVPTE